jgi:hypothetical protein
VQANRRPALPPDREPHLRELAGRAHDAHRRATAGDQSDALKAHRQEVCYAAQGFEIRALEHGALSTAGRTIPVTRMLAVQGERSEPVTYWFTMGDRVVLGRAERLRVQLENGFARRIPTACWCASRASRPSRAPPSPRSSPSSPRSCACSRGEAARFVGRADPDHGLDRRPLPIAWRLRRPPTIAAAAGARGARSPASRPSAPSGARRRGRRRGGRLVCVSLFACIFCMRDFRVGVALLILIMPISQSYVFPTRCSA